jgi:hypothetical protein
MRPTKVRTTESDITYVMETYGASYVLKKPRRTIPMQCTKGLYHKTLRIGSEIVSNIKNTQDSRKSGRVRIAQRRCHTGMRSVIKQLKTPTPVLSAVTMMMPLKMEMKSRVGFRPYIRMTKQNTRKKTIICVRKFNINRAINASTKVTRG